MKRIYTLIVLTSLLLGLSLSTFAQGNRRHGRPGRIVKGLGHSGMQGDVIINGVTGFLHEVGDVEGLARSVSTLLSQPKRAALMGARARELVTVKFDPAKLRAAWVNVWIDTARARRRA